MSALAAAVLETRGGESAVLEEVRAEASINDLLAEVTVTQRYRNPGANNIEAVYTFPLPLDGVLLGFEVEIEDRKLVGKVVKKSDAEDRYEDAITDGDTAIMLEQSQPGLYTANVGNLLPGETATIKFRYGLLLRWNGDRVRFMMPTTIAPRYGDPGSAGLAPHQTPEYTPDAERSFNLRVTVRGILEDAHFASSSHDVAVRPGPGKTIIEFVGRPSMDRDFVLEARASRSRASGALIAPDLDGWVVLASFRPEISEGERSECRSVNIVVDCSGSMAGDSIGQARSALVRILDSLRDGDLFNIIAFGSGHKALFDRETPVSPRTSARARRFISALDADMGGTEIGCALDAAFEARSEADLSRDLLLITDGEVWDDDNVIPRAKRSGHRIFTVGVGSSVAEPFVRGLAEATGGACELVAPRDDMAVRIHRHFQRMYAPRARSAGIRWPGKALRSMPNPLQTVYGGDTLHAFAWFAEKPAGMVGLEVTLADGRTVTHETEVCPFDDGPTATAFEGASCSTLARLAAARCLCSMDDCDQATEHAVRYQLMSQWTNYIVVHVRADGEKADDLPDIHKVPQVLAAGWHGTGTVFAKRMDFQRLAMFSHSHKSECRAMISDSDECECQDLSPRLRSVAEIIGPPELVQLLNARTIPPFPTLDDFEAWGMPESIVEALLDLVERGEDEKVVVAVFLHMLAKSEAGKGLERQVRRQILKVFKTLPPDTALISYMQDFFQGRDWSESVLIRQCID